ncbi:hypothetical protein [Bacillus thuringiensis]|uniref:hypothetical protein n=1 Tax=Bacillus thuringiensis TaxID=1428 RepID=UPI001EDD6EC1|nr:hypothetical protein [Bacillus thuringiensis]MCG3426531.1 hypothetical protein [Bacillus thuringiensis]
MHYNVKYKQRMGEIIILPESEEDDYIKFYLLTGTREDEVVGLAHLYEHLLVDQVEEKYSTGIYAYTNRDVICIKIMPDKDNCAVLKYLLQITTDAVFDILNKSYLKHTQSLIGQELALKSANMSYYLQDSPYEALWDRNGLGKEMDHPNVDIRWDIFNSYINRNKASQFSILLSQKQLNHLKDIFSHIEVGENENVVFNKDSSCSYLPKVIDKKLGSNLPTNSMVKIMGYGLYLKGFEDKDLYYITLISRIINKKIQVLRKYSCYLAMCYPIFHRNEVSFFIMYSSTRNQMDQVDQKIKNILQENVTEMDVAEISNNLNSLNDKKVQEIREEMAALY